MSFRASIRPRGIIAIAILALTISGAALSAQAAAGIPPAQIQEMSRNQNLIQVQRHYPRRAYRNYNRNNWVAPAIVLGIIGTAAAISLNQQYYGIPYDVYYAPAPGYNGYPLYYAPQRALRRCYIETDPVSLRGYWSWCR